VLAAQVSMRRSRTVPRSRLVQAQGADRATGLRDEGEAEITKTPVIVCRQIDQQIDRQQPSRGGGADGPHYAANH